MNLEKLREETDQIDLDMMVLFKKRMELSLLIGAYKKEHQLPVLDKNREQWLLLKRKEQFDDELLWPYYERILKELMKVSREYQE
ncbi:MAG: chorismate mutase [Acholeplasmataceae bacterium]|nr:chorismate mutase [Acholeplasmataceae bacterium]